MFFLIATYFDENGTICNIRINWGIFLADKEVNLTEPKTAFNCNQWLPIGRFCTDIKEYNIFKNYVRKEKNIK